MAGFSLFGNYNKPGPGVSKDAPQKPPVPRFFELLFRKFFNLVQLNFLFLVPVVIAGVLIYLISRITTIAFLINLPLLLISPFMAGITLITRNYAREEHAFLTSDFKDAVQNNWKQFAINGLICYVVGNIILFCVQFYYTLAASQGSWFMIPFGISVATFLLFLFIQYYVPLMIVTFELTLKQIYKNGLIFAIVGLWRNILLTLIFGALLFANYFLFYMYPAPMILIDGAILLFFAFSMGAFLINFTVYPLVERLMIQPILEKQNPQTEQGDNATSALKEGEGQPSEPEYVFINGKLVQKNSEESQAVFQDESE